MAATTLAPGTSTPALFGRDEVRIDGDLKARGAAKYAGDFEREGMLWAAFVASPFPHARIAQIDVAAAKALDGVRAVLTGEDIGERFFGCTLRDWPVLAYGVVRFVGEYVVAVAADTPAIAEAAAALVDVTYEELPAFLDPERSIAPDAPLFHPDEREFAFLGGKRPARPHVNMQGYDCVTKGDPGSALASATRTFEHTFYTPRYHAGYIEPRATLVWIERETLHVVASNKMPFGQRDQLAAVTGLPKENVVIEPVFIGGEFGAKALTIEEFPLYFLARATNKPVKHVRKHMDDIRSTGVRHASKVTVRAGVDDVGRIVAISVRALFDGGAYGAVKTSQQVLPGKVPKFPYGVSNVCVERIAAYTNTVPGAFVRAPGDVQITFAVESLIDMMASELGIDQVEFRLLNATAVGHSDTENSPILEPRAREVLVTLRDAMSWSEPLPRGRGRGIALTARHMGGGKTSLIVTANSDGTVDVLTGACEPGVGTLTVIQRVIAADLGIAADSVRVCRGGTDTALYDPGIGGSRGTFLLGGAARDAVQKLSAELERGTALPIRVVGSFEHVHKSGEPEYLTFGAYGIELSVDFETGALTIHDVVLVADTGTIINPIAFRGQIDGGFLMGLGHALTEELRIDEGRLVNIALSDYKLPCQRDMPPFRVIMLPPGNGTGPFGARAVGEFNTTGVAPAIANAVAAAAGVRIDRLAITAERIYEALNAVDFASPGAKEV